MTQKGYGAGRDCIARIVPTIRQGIAAWPQDMMDATTASGAYSGAVEFTGQEDNKKGKFLNNAATREALHWQPKYKSFVEFMAAGARDWYTENPIDGAPHKE